MVEKRRNSSANEIIVPDNGCLKAKAAGYIGKCIDCPFPKCFEDIDNRIKPQTVRRRHQRRKDLPARNAEIIRLKQGGVTYAELALKFGLGEKTIEGVCREQ